MGAPSYKLSPAEREDVFLLAGRLTGSCQTGEYRRDVLIYNVEGRMQETDSPTLASYLRLAESDQQEFARLLSALTIHTTFWFREYPHFECLVNEVRKKFVPQRNRPFRVLSLGCSSGEEVYSFGLTFELLRRSFPGFEYSITGWDIDPLSIATAQRAVYPIDGLSKIPNEFRHLLLLGEGTSQGFFTLDPTIRRRTNFSVRNIGQIKGSAHMWDLIICRNVLIYFSPIMVAELVEDFIKSLREGGLLCLGHSEVVDPKDFAIKGLGHAIYLKEGQKSEAKHKRSLSLKQQVFEMRPKALVVDDSKTMRVILQTLLTEAGFVVSVSESPMDASKILARQKFDVITLDINMPKLDGLSWLSNIRSAGNTTPCILISDENPNKAAHILGAITNGAQDFISKETLRSTPQIAVEKVSAIAVGEVKRTNAEGEAKTDASGIIRPALMVPDIIVIGASTGGPEALSRLLKDMPLNTPPIIVVQHIPSNFATAFTQQLCNVSGLTLGKVENEEPLKPNHLYVALGDYHIGVKQVGREMVLITSQGPLINGHRPSVDYLFSSTAKVRKSIMAIILTGMGNDGALGMKELKTAGALTMGQDEHSSVVFGMPKEAQKLGGVEFMASLWELRSMLLDCLDTQKVYKATIKNPLRMAK